MKTPRKSPAAVAQPLDILDAPSALLNIETVKAATGWSKATIYRKCKDPADPIPRPVRVGKNSVRWAAGAFKAYLDQLGEQSGERGA